VTRDAGKPNVILILADDMGFADLGITGSEICTPNIDGLEVDSWRVGDVEHPTPRQRGLRGCRMKHRSFCIWPIPRPIGLRGLHRDQQRMRPVMWSIFCRPFWR
jgi:hypothetical protein